MRLKCSLSKRGRFSLVFLSLLVLLRSGVAAPPAKPTIVVAKGLFNSAESFQRISEVDEYFSARGYSVIFAATPRGQSIDERTEVLIREIHQKLPQGPFHLLAISMGGLDSRKALFLDDDLRQRCLSLTTVASPHRGSPVAHAATLVLGWLVPTWEKIFPSPTPEKAPLLIRLIRAAKDLDSATIDTQFNAQVPPPVGVPVASISTAIDLDSFRFDGLVGTESGTWGEHLGTIEADHMSAVARTFRKDRPDLKTWDLIAAHYSKIENQTLVLTPSSSAR